MSGAFNDYASAAQHKVDMVVEGWRGAFIVAYKRGQGKRVNMKTAGVTAEKAAEVREMIKSGKIASSGETVIERKEEKVAEFDKSRIKFKIPEATFLLWLDCRELNLNDEALHQYFIHKKLGLSQGVFFGTGGTGYMRLNIAISKEILKNIKL
jgi:bifunctional pyridoxal-dependent enzyme with beta-cystathionase and maltose regulon repressor activities